MCKCVKNFCGSSFVYLNLRSGFLELTSERIDKVQNRKYHIYIFMLFTFIICALYKLSSISTPSLCSIVIEKLIVTHLVNKFPAYYGTRVHKSPPPASILRLGNRSGCLLSGISTSIAYNFLIFPTRATYPVNFILLGLSILLVFDLRDRIMSVSLSTLFLMTVNSCYLCFSHRRRH